MSSLILYILTFIFFIISYKKDKEKTKKALLKGCKSIENILPQFLGIILIVGLTLAILNPETIARIIGSNSGISGVFLSAILGSIAMMPTFVAFSTGDMLLKNGAGIAQVTALISTLTLIGIISIPLEMKYIGKRAAIYRNILAFVFSIIVAFFVEMVVTMI
ncbi:permease [Clostridium sp. AL.422]|uniref:permease n=1 Tax=Clostridium TaxID=1485 RepID=UPI00293DCE05|nr:MULTISPECIES: permease [unclassified Clostridium]MDV4152656.1 permease [Clostridium sp. AL.422]